MGQLTGRHALVTGGARGLGAGMAQALAAAGAAVMIGDEASWEAAVATTVEQLGGLDILVNDAGIEISGLIVGAVIEQTPAGRLGEVSDMAEAVVFLASDQARFITGAGLPVDGGMGM